MSKAYEDNRYQKTNMPLPEEEQDINRTEQKSGTSVSQRLQRYSFLIPWIFLLALTIAELAVGYWSIRVGMVLHIVLLIAMLMMAVLSWYYWEVQRTADSPPGRQVGSPVQPETNIETDASTQSKGGRIIGIRAFHSYRFYIGFSIAPLIRILSLSMPLQGVAVQYIYLITGIPLLAAIIVAARMAGFQMSDLYLSRKNRQKPRHSWKVQLAIALIGIPLGLMEYSILRPEPIIPQLTPGAVVTASVILIIFTGFTEELTFRGVMKRATDDLFGVEISAIYVSLVFAVLHITHLSALDVFFVFGIGLLFSSIVQKTESLYGVTLAHGLTNINLFIFGPHLLG
ncbi:MAG: type II CAAX endopeptidase family protein [Syntrophaceticus sp.]|nr:type II CAAX endopeptidase family protein [Syntrophaceticus sp.]MDD4783316.1 type II CAAX endopeptidase family protein [Syntrophaceticus sp.]